MKRPPDRKLVLAVAVLLMAASAMLARSADHGKGEMHFMNQVLGAR